MTVPWQLAKQLLLPLGINQAHDSVYGSVIKRGSRASMFRYWMEELKKTQGRFIFSFIAQDPLRRSGAVVLNT
jgi:hypothetical protein